MHFILAAFMTHLGFSPIVLHFYILLYICIYSVMQKTYPTPFGAGFIFGQWVRDSICIGIREWMPIKVALRQAVARNSPQDCCIFDRSNQRACIKQKSPTFRLSFLFWQRMRDSNPRERSQSPVCYRYTNPLSFCL